MPHDLLKIYKGLDVVTAKASIQEREMATHHLLDILEPHQMFTVVDFRNRALKIIENLTEQGKVPIVVGGTNYYIESIVYKILVEDMDDNEALLWDKSRRKRDLDSSERKKKKQEKEAGKHEEEEKAVQVKDDEEEEKNEEPSTSQAPEEPFDITKFQLTKEQLQRDVDNEAIFTNEEIHMKLYMVDPKMAKRLHPNNRRKILR
ncbi:hypothetical protein PYW07_013628 [Mythimna separata]|uniref:Uncharacterized protein n=1 Tax=Mythimna separata TaxID=271217 RepID=A0AAD7YF39_MYTSE|nr:hypothetical protein PYW07_013628 [Mythimna separata]